jgi:hypothetical protein
MAVFPAGKLADNSPLTGTEAAVLIAVDQWAQKNTDWYSYNNILRGGMIASCILIVVGVAAYVISIVGALLLLLFYLLKTISNPEPVLINRIGATLHSVVYWNGIPHLVSKNPQYHSIINVREGLGSRSIHSSENYPALNAWRQGEDNFFQLSLDSIINLGVDENDFLNLIQSTPINSNTLKILTGHNSIMTHSILAELGDTHIGEDVAQIAVLVDRDVCGEMLANFDWIKNLIEYNDQQISIIINGMNHDRIPYEEWSRHLMERTEEMNFVTIDSTKQGWINSLVGLLRAEESLENSVAADIIAQEESIHREMEETEAKMREKTADYRLGIAEEGEKLERRISEVSGMIEAQSQTINKLHSIQVNPKLTLQSKYGVASGGGGYVGAQGGSVSPVVTTVNTHSYEVSNPAYPAILGIIKLAEGDLFRFQQMDQSLKNEIEGLSGAIDRRSDQMRKQQEERLEELENAKERAIHAIKKDSREVRNIEYLNKSIDESPWNKLIQRNAMIWSRPHQMVLSGVRKHQQLTINAEAFQLQINNETNQVRNFLSTKSFHGILDANHVTHHWVTLDGIPHSEIICQKPIEFTNSSSIQIEAGESKFILGIESKDIAMHKVNANQIAAAINSLAMRGAISPDVFAVLNKLKDPQLLVEGLF